MQRSIHPQRLRLVLAWLARRVPALEPHVTRFSFAQLIPLHRRTGLRIHEVDSSRNAVTLRLPFKPGNCNAAGTVHGGIIMALAESVHGFALVSRFGAMRHQVFTREAQLRYVRKARSDLYARFVLERGVGDSIAAQLERSATADVELESTVTDVEGLVVAQLVGRYRIRRLERRVETLSPVPARHASERARA